MKAQRSCGSCAAFSSIAAIETCFKKKVGVLATTLNNSFWTVGMIPTRGLTAVKELGPMPT